MRKDGVGPRIHRTRKRDKQEAKRAHREWEGVGDGVRRITIILFKNVMI